MAKLEPLLWTPDMSVGVDFLDDQHKYLLRLINQLADYKNLNTKSEAIADALGKMIDYAQNHFKSEELLLAEFGYTETEKQKDAHREFIKKTVRFCQATSMDLDGVPEKLVTYLMDWWTSHILGEDMNYKGVIPKDATLL